MLPCLQCPVTEHSALSHQRRLHRVPYTSQAGREGWNESPGSNSFVLIDAEASVRGLPVLYNLWHNGTDCDSFLDVGVCVYVGSVTEL